MGMSSSCATTWASMVIAPWPMSASALCTMTRPSSLTLTTTVEPSQLPMVRLPLTCITHATPTPRRKRPGCGARLRRVFQSRASTHWSRQSRRPVLAIFQPCTEVSPASMAFRRCTATGSRSSLRAMVSMWLLSANCICVPPKPRKAPCGGVCV
jgi:hypothetical protein